MRFVVLRGATVGQAKKFCGDLPGVGRCGIVSISVLVTAKVENRVGALEARIGFKKRRPAMCSEALLVFCCPVES